MRRMPEGTQLTMTPPIDILAIAATRYYAAHDAYAATCCMQHSVHAAVRLAEAYADMCVATADLDRAQILARDLRQTESQQ